MDIAIAVVVAAVMATIVVWTHRKDRAWHQGHRVMMVSLEPGDLSEDIDLCWHKPMKENKDVEEQRGCGGRDSSDK